MRLKEPINSTLRAFRVIGQRKTFCWQKIPEFSCAGKETVDIDICITSRNCNRKTMQSIKIMSGPSTRTKK